MLTFIIRRLLITIPMMLVISFLVYLGLELTPGDAVSHMIDPEAAARMTEEQFAEMREALGLNKTFLERYWIWLTNVVQGNFGHSLSGGVAISTIVLDRLPATLELSVFALVFSTLIGCVLGTLSALRRGSGTDNALTVVGMLGVSIPEFFFGLVAILIFALNLGWLPAGGRLLPGYETIFDRLPHIVLPGIVLSLMMTAGVMRYARSSMLDSLSREFIRTARAKGLPAWRINLIHGFRVALTPVVVLIGFRLPTLIGGSVIIEQVFQWPGIGSEFIGAVRGSDYPLVMMIALLSVFAVLMASLIVDVLTALIDPRVRLG
ncbi:ABC transporter permease [Thalassovita sp.]|jgi:peptide/nickel transport system permease protein|uniref:ABC transporter permease n=1 Tax=Thalassovita sp. TaxID=1979401 RepID=UPI002AB10B1D|nr:ABC transporter permease [Thalassovita sp.]